MHEKDITNKSPPVTKIHDKFITCSAAIITVSRATKKERKQKTGAQMKLLEGDSITNFQLNRSDILRNIFSVALVLLLSLLVLFFVLVGCVFRPLHCLL